MSNSTLRDELRRARQDAEATGAALSLVGRTLSKAIAELEGLMAENERLIFAGSRLSNAAYNLAQMSALPSAYRDSLREGAKAWDEAVRSKNMVGKG